MKKLNKKGFTIVELVIVIAVIAILAAVLIPTYSSVVEKANKSAAMQEGAALYKEALALDLSDGVQDGKDGETKIETVNGKNVTYTVTTTNGTTTIKFVYTAKAYKVTYDGTKWEYTTVSTNS